MSGCYVCGCNARHKARGMCLIHYSRWHSREYSRKNHDKILERGREYIRLHRDENRERCHKYYTLHQKERTEYYRQYRRTESGKEATIRAIQNYEKKNPERRRIWTLAKNIPFSRCIVCGESRVHRHHPDLNSPMDVIFLCPLHHKQVETGSLVV